MDLKDFATVVAGLLSDGSHTDKVIYFTNTDITLINHFKNALRRLYNLDNKRFGGDWKKLKKHNLKRIYFCSKDLVTKLTKYSPTFTTIAKHINDKKIYPNCKIPSIILNGGESIKKEFLKMYASCDGDVEVYLRYVTKEKRYDIWGAVCFVIDNPNIKKQVFDVLLSLGYSTTFEDGRIRICRKKDIIKYSKEVGFVKECKISNSNPRVHFYWSDKNDVLSLLAYVIQFGIPKELSKVKKSKTNKYKIKRYLEGLLKRIERGEELNLLKFKQRRNFLNKEEKNWIISWKGKWGKKVVYNKNELRVSINTIAKLFLERYGKDIDPTTVFWYWKKKC